MHKLSETSSFAPQPAAVHAIAIAEPAELRAHVLVVEDNPITQLVTLAQLRELGCTPATAMSGAEALEARKNQHFDLILLDCRLPDVDGYATARAIREYERSGARERVAIVAVTCDDDIECVDKCIAAGMDGHLPKPTSVAVLRDTLARYLR